MECGGSENGLGDRFPDDWMPGMKLLGQRLMAWGFDRKVVEVQIHIAVMNGYTALGIPDTVDVG